MAEYSREEIMMLTDMVVPGSIYDEQGRLLPIIDEAVNEFMHYDGIMSMSMALTLNDPAQIRANIDSANVVKLMVFLKFLKTKINENYDKILVAIQEYVIYHLIKELTSRSESDDTEE